MILPPRLQEPGGRAAGTCGEEPMRRQEELRRNLDLHLVFRQLEDGKVLLLPLVVRDSPFGSIIG